MNYPVGFLKHPPLTASKKAQQGRFVCSDIQWTGDGDDILGTFTITARELLAAADSNLLWTDQDVQRGVKPECPNAPTELSLAQGYPDDRYVFIIENADDIADKLLHGKSLYLNPLIWNLRPGKFEGYFDDKTGDFHIYSGKIYLPDSHHRHQGLLKAARIFRESPDDYPKFSLDKQFKIDLYFLSRADEGNYFFDKNQRPRQTAKSKAFDLTSQDALSLLAKGIASKSSALQNNVNRVTDRLTSKNPQVITLSTLREMSRNLISDDHLDESEVEGLSEIAAGFYDMLATIRPELAQLPSSERNEIRKESLVDAGVMMHGYAALMKQYMNDMAKLGSQRAPSFWRERLSRLARDKIYNNAGWTGDLFEKDNPLWLEQGVVRPNSAGTSLSQVNNGATRATTSRILLAIVRTDSPILDLKNLVLR